MSIQLPYIRWPWLRQRLVGAYKTQRPARDIAVDDEWVFVVVGQSEYEGSDRSLSILRRVHEEE